MYVCMYLATICYCIQMYSTIVFRRCILIIHSMRTMFALVVPCLRYG